jgi:hypothetical protein
VGYTVGGDMELSPPILDAGHVVNGRIWIRPLQQPLLIMDILMAGSQGNVLPTPQFDKLEYLSSPVARPDLQNILEAYWETLDAERDQYLVDVLNDLTSGS